MNQHPANQVFAAIKRIAEPEFTSKLSFDEQNAMAAADPAKYGRYVDWLFGVNEPLVRRRVFQERTAQRDHDAEYERDRA